MPAAKKKKFKICFEPSGLTVTVDAGTTLLDAANKVGIYVSCICGGDGYCGKCKLVIDNGKYTTRQTAMLTPEEEGNSTVLACQTDILSDVTVTVPKWHDLQTGRILVDSQTSQTSPATVLDPLVSKLYLEMPRPSINDHTADHERLYLAIKHRVDTETIQTGLRTLQKLSRVLSKADYKVTVTIGHRGGTTELIDVESGDQSKRNYAMAIDLGTTTVVAHLVDTCLGTTVDKEATYNSQINFGEDYIRRIIYAEEHDAFDQLQKRIVNDVNELIVTLATRNRVDLSDITSCVCSGNTAMTHFLLKLDPTGIRREPFVASADFVPPIRAAEAGIHINKRGLLYCLPSVAAYVGGDIVAGVLSTGINTNSDLTLLVDIGTNGEVVLGNKDWLICASSSAGPAFEGSGVKHGMRASAGAIEKLRILDDGSIECETIGDVDPIGICGSGLLDTMAQLVKHGIIDRTGRFICESDPRLTDGDQGKQFQLVPPHNGHDEIVITQADISNLMRSKAGVFASIRVLMDSTQIGPGDLDAVYLAGGFGNYMNTDNAIEIGMLPDVAKEKIHFVGNTSMAGAKKVLLSRDALATAESIASNMTYFDLMSHPAYMDEFIRASFLPHTDLTLFPSVVSSKIKN
jgi:uncharacterized 2Fe-2S/4Fe-4S cluster protein (DUF4445 family)